MKPLAVALIALVLAPAVAPGVLAGYDGYAFRNDLSLHRDGERVRTFALDPSEKSGGRADFAPGGRFLAFVFVNASGGHGIRVYDIARDRVVDHDAGERTIARFEWLEYADDCFVIYSTDFCSESAPVMVIVDPYTGRPVFYGESMVYGGPQGAVRGITYYRYTSPSDPLRATMLAFDDLFSGVAADPRWRPGPGKEPPFYVMPPSKARGLIRARARGVVEAIRTGDPGRIADTVHPEAGLRISIDGHVDENEDPLFSRDEIRVAGDDDARIRLGAADGTGEPIHDTLAGYLRRIGGVDYGSADAVGYNRVIGRGNTINNVFEFFPEAIVVEYYWGGSEKYAGLDWRSVRLVFRMGRGNWYLAGIVEDQWTI
jgi:hypothetical protein